jgi:predicted nucleic acid-binding protein
LAKTVVADTGPLIAFGRIGKLDLLPQVLGEILVPNAVVAECLADLGKPGALAIREALRARLLTKSPDPSPAQEPFPVLDAGESAAIRLAVKLSASVLIDEKTGRAIATKLGLTVIGSGGVLLAAKKRGLIPTVKPILDAIAGNGYHFSDALIRAILSRASER